MERLDYIPDYYLAPDFVEFVGRIGGDTITYRVSLSRVCLVFFRRLLPVI